MKRFGYPKRERIKSKKIFEETFLQGRKLISENQLLRCSYLVKDTGGYSIKVAFVTNKKSGKATWRNRVKRILREIYRLNKLPLIESLKVNKKSLTAIVSIYKVNQQYMPKVCMSDFKSELIDILTKIKEEIEKT